MAEGRLRLAADIGGTFTDIAVFDEKSGKLTFGKALSTPSHLVEGISAGAGRPRISGRSHRAAVVGADRLQRHRTARGLCL